MRTDVASKAYGYTPPAAASHGAPAGRPTLVRAIGRWGLTAAVVNSVVGGGIFGLPSSVAGFVGAWGPVAVLVAGVCVFAVVLCFAEVGSRFEDGGGPYRYATAAFGPTVGFHVGWLHLWSRTISGAAVLNLFASYLATLVPAAATPAGRAVAMTAATVLVTATNVRGVRQASWAVNLFTVAKLLPIVLLLALGLPHVSRSVLATQAVPHASWAEAVLLLMFAYGGFESAVIATGEARDPRRDVPFALVWAMAAVTLLYAAVQLVVTGLLPHAAASATPVAGALGVVLGTAGVVVTSATVLVSVYGWLTGFALMTPRILHAMAERHEVPELLGRLGRRGRTPWVAIVLNSGVALAIGLAGGFTQAATAVAIIRMLLFASTCAALPVLRRGGARPSFRLPFGTLVTGASLAFCVWLLATRSLTQAWMLAALIVAGALVQLAMRGTR
jgi:amino acid transporter